MMTDPNKLLAALKVYKVDHVNDRIITKVNKNIIEMGEYAAVLKSSVAAAGLYKWVANTVKCYTVHKQVEPLNKKVKDMKERCAKMTADLKETEEL